MCSSPTLDIAIIGAGIAGLSTALAISKLPNTNHRISVYESASELSEFGAGIQLSANATRILESLGVGHAFRGVVNEPNVMQVRRYADDSIIGEIAQNPQSEWEYGFPHWQVYRPDFQRLLLEACMSEGEERTKISFRKRATSVDVDGGKVTFEDGIEVTVDLVIAADGLRGKLRHCIPEGEGIQARPFKEFCFRAVVSKEKMMQHPETEELMQAGSLNMVWCGPGASLLGYPVAAGSLYNIVLSRPRPADEDAVGKWSQPGDIKEGAAILEPFCARVRKLWSLVEKCNKWTIGDLPALPTFVSQNGRVAIIGDAAHAVIPHSGQGGCQALEDAASLAACIEVVRDKSDMRRAMQTWNSVRQQRLQGVRLYASGNQQFLSMIDGPAQQKRDEMWGNMTAQWKKELLDLGEEGVKNKPKVEGKIMSGDMRAPETRMWLFGYDAAGEARKAAKAVFCS